MTFPLIRIFPMSSRLIHSGDVVPMGVDGPPLERNTYRFIVNGGLHKKPWTTLVAALCCKATIFHMQSASRWNRIKPAYIGQRMSHS